jgi:hypothetical protein
MMNSEFVARQARSLAGQLLSDGALDDAGRIGGVYFRVLGRPARETERERALDYIRLFPGKQDDQGGRLLAWTSFCRALIASNEFLYIR